MRYRPSFPLKIPSGANYTDLRPQRQPARCPHRARAGARAL